jgi:predicted dehydrogenase
MDHPIRWGIIGCGDVTEVKSGPAFQRVEGSTITIAMRRDREKARDWARRHGVARSTDDAHEVLEDPEVDAIYVATPPDGHASYAIAAMRAGKPVYVEKPMARTSAECDAMNAVARETGIPLYVAYYRRALPRFRAVAAHLAEIGRPRLVRVAFHRPASAAERATPPPWRVLPEIAGGGIFVDLASHTFDLLDHLLGPIGGVSGRSSNQARRYPAEDTVSVAFEFGGESRGVLGSGVWCFDAATRRDEVQIVGDEGEVSFATFDDAPIRVVSKRGVEELRIPHPPHIQQPLIASVVEALHARRRGEERSVPSTGLTAARTTRVLEAALGLRSPGD